VLSDDKERNGFYKHVAENICPTVGFYEHFGSVSGE